MFVFPPYPPKDYVLKDVAKAHLSASEFTPNSEPRVTQTNVGLFCSPVDYKEGEAPVKNQAAISPHPQIIEKWANEARAWWIGKPGKDDRFLHHMYKKYNVSLESYNPNYRHMEKVFNRSYKYELVCLEERRLQKLRDKCEREQAIWEDKFTRVQRKEHEASNPPMKVLECKRGPPFWWEKNLPGVQADNSSKDDLPALEKPSSERWAQEPCITALVVDDPCRRKYEMELVGQPFKTEACKFYYTHYPPPDITFRPKKSVHYK